MEPSVFVTSMPLNLRGYGPLPPIETLYLPACALRVLSESELDAVIGHELGHFRGSDQQFSKRFVPSYASLRDTWESISDEFEGHGHLATAGKLARIPAQVLVNGICVILVRAVNNIRRMREFEADRAGVEVSSAAAQASALVKISLLMLMWSRFQSANARYVASGHARRNLSDRYVKIIV